MPDTAIKLAQEVERLQAQVKALRGAMRKLLSVSTRACLCTNEVGKCAKCEARDAARALLQGGTDAPREG